MEYDKRNGNVVFAEGPHKYWDLTNPSANYISVTTLIHSFAQPFDAEFWSAYKALEKFIPKDKWYVEKKSLQNSKKFDKIILSLYDIPEIEFERERQNILDQWDKNKNEACERGTKIHSDIENSFYAAANNIELKKFGIGGKFECRKDYTDLDIEYGVYPEYLIHYETKDKELCLAGQIDLMIKSGNDIILVDHKTNKSIDQRGGFDSKTKQTAKMLYPLNNLDDCNFSQYSLQLSTYAWMLQQINPEFKIKDLILNHYDHNDNNTLYHCEYKKDEVVRMLAYYKKQLTKQKQQERRKPIEY